MPSYRNRNSAWKPTPAPRFIYQQADWERYRNIIDNGIKNDMDKNYLSTPNDIEFETIYLANLIQSARNQSIPIFQKRKFNRKTLINKSVGFWETLLQDYRSGNVSLRKIEGLVEGFSTSPIDQVKTNYVSDDRDRDIAYQFADVFKQANETTQYWTHPNDVIVRNCLSSLANETSKRPPSLTIKSEDVQNVIQTLKPTKSAGPDRIQSILMINLPQSAIRRLTEIFNACLALTYWPTYFKSAKIIPILKSGKDPSDARNYRPISLTNCIGKIFEKLVKEQIEEFVMKRKIIPPQQFGFRKKHCPLMQTKRITCFISESKTFNKSVGLVKLDVEKASDSVWHDGLIYKLKTKFNFPPTLWKLINSFIRGREYIVFVKGSKSYKVKMTAGLAQGTVLNPLLYSLYVSDIPIPTNVELAMYADDIAIYTSGHHPNDTINNLNYALKIMHGYFIQWKIKINKDKLEAIIFPIKHQRQKPSIDILFENAIVPLQQSIKYLGITLDEKLTFEEHINVVIDKAMFYFEKFLPLFRNVNMTSRIKLLLYTTVIRPILGHGSPICSKASPNSLEKLYKLQQIHLKSIFNLPSRYSAKLMEKYLRIPHLSRYLDRVNGRFARKCEKSEFPLVKAINHNICVITVASRNNCNYN